MGTPGQMGVELRVVPPPPVICLLFWLLLQGGPTSDPGQQGLCPHPLNSFPPMTFSSKLLQGWGFLGLLFVRPFLFFSAATTIITTVPSLPQMLLHLPQRVQAVLDLHIWSWARQGGASPWGELVPRGLSLSFC